MARRPRNRDGSTGNGQQLLMDENGDKRDRSDETPSLAEINARDAGADFNFMALVQAAEDRDQTFKGAIQRHAWRKAYAAFHNRHESGSKYESERWRKKRSTIFRPKTRSAVRKNMAAAAASMFSTDDVVNVTPLYDGDPLRSASAEVLQQCLKYRLDRTAGNAGISDGDVITLGAQDALQLSGVGVVALDQITRGGAVAEGDDSDRTRLRRPDGDTPQQATECDEPDVFQHIKIPASAACDTMAFAAG